MLRLSDLDRRKSDEELRKTDSYRPHKSNAAKDRKLAENIYAGPGYKDVPDPEFPLGDIGVRKYFELCGRLLEQGKLTFATRATAEQVAILTETQYHRMSCGQRIPVSLTRDLQRFLAMLRLTDEIAPIGGNVTVQHKENPFEPVGSLLIAFTPERLRGSAAAPPGSRAS